MCWAFPAILLAAAKHGEFWDSCLRRFLVSIYWQKDPPALPLETLHRSAPVSLVLPRWPLQVTEQEGFLSCPDACDIFQTSRGRNPINIPKRAAVQRGSERVLRPWLPSKPVPSPFCSSSVKWGDKQYSRHRDAGLKDMLKDLGAGPSIQ